MDCTLPNQDNRRKRATRQAKTVNIIIGCQRASGWTWAELTGAVCNGAGLIRDGNAYRLIASSAYEQGMLS